MVGRTGGLHSGMSTKKQQQSQLRQIALLCNEINRMNNADNKIIFAYNI